MAPRSVPAPAPCLTAAEASTALHARSARPVDPALLVRAILRRTAPAAAAAAAPLTTPAPAAGGTLQSTLSASRRCASSRRSNSPCGHHLPCASARARDAPRGASASASASALRLPSTLTRGFSPSAPASRAAKLGATRTTMARRGFGGGGGKRRRRQGRRAAGKAARCEARKRDQHCGSATPDLTTARSKRCSLPDASRGRRDAAHAMSR